MADWGEIEPTMRPLDYVAVHPFLADVLAGEFRVPHGKNHTLGRLMVAAYQKGAIGQPDPEERRDIEGPGQIDVFRYEPSWMPGAIASAYTRLDPRLPQLPILTGIRIESAYSPGLHIAQHESGLRVVRPGESINQDHMELGPGLQRQRQTFAELAGAFFGQVYDATHPSGSTQP